MSHKVIRISNLNGVESCTICGQPAIRVNDTLEHKPAPKLDMETASTVPLEPPAIEGPKI